MFKVWYIPQVPMKAFEHVVDDLKTAENVLSAIYEFSAFEYENKVKPDYADMGGIAEWNTTDKSWEDVDGDRLTDPTLVW